MEQNGSPYVVVSSPGMHDMAERVVALIGERHDLHLRHVRLEVETFANGEVMVYVPETVRRQHVFFFHELQHPSPNDALMTLLVANDALRRASVTKITLITPYIAYLRQDRKHKPRVPISARMLADLIESNKSVQELITADMHAEQEQGFFSIPVDNLLGLGLFAEHFKRHLSDELVDAVIVAPDFGGAVRARRFAKKIDDAPVAIFEKRRPRANQSEAVSLIGESVVGKIAIVCDDMIDTGGTIRGVAKKLKEMGARKVYVCATHGIFSGNAEQAFAELGFPILCTNSIPRNAEYYAQHASWLNMIPMEELLAETIYESSLIGGSISKFNS